MTTTDDFSQLSVKDEKDNVKKKKKTAAQTHCVSEINVSETNIYV